MTNPLLGKARLVHVRLPIEAAERLDHGDACPALTHNFDRIDLPRGSHLVALVTCDSECYKWVGVVSKEAATSTLQQRVRLSHLETIQPLVFGSLLQETEARFRKYARSTIDGPSISSFPQKTGEAVIAAAIALSPSFAEKLEQVLAHVGPDRVVAIPSESAWSLVVQEKDGGDLSLALAGMSASHFTDAISITRRPEPALALLSGFALEDRQIEVDASAFGGYELISRDIRGASVFQDQRCSNTVTVINANRHALEQTLGVDLIIHHERYDSFLLVQYKRLMPEKPKTTPRGKAYSGSVSWRYRPSRDASYYSEIDRMCAVRALLSQPESRCPRDFRLNGDPFFFKFCRADTLDPDSRGMVSGLYVMAIDLQRFLASSYSLGPRGGHFIGHDNYSRRFPNTMFVRLSQEGWIGTRSVSTAAISRYVDSALASRKSVLLSRVTS